jgi:hypothetical protein
MAVALCLTVIAPLATPAGATSSSRVALAAKLHRPLTKAGRARIIAAIRRLAASRARARTGYHAPVKPKPKVGPIIRARRRALAARKLRAKRLAARRRARTGALHAKKPVKKTATHKPAPLSVPQLAGFALAPFVLMGIYLLGADHLRRRVPRKRRRRASFVITRVGDH